MNNWMNDWKKKVNEGYLHTHISNVLTKSARNKKQAFSWVELLVFHRLSPTIFFKVTLCQRKTSPILICIPGMCEVLKIKYLAEEHNTAQWRIQTLIFF